MADYGASKDSLADLTLRRPKKEVLALLEEQISKGNELQEGELETEDFPSFVEECRTWHTFNAELLRSSFSSPTFTQEFQRIGNVPNPNDFLFSDSFIEKADAYLMRGNAVLSRVKSLLRLVPDASQVKVVERQAKTNRTARNRIFLVHGHDHGAMHEVARYLEGCDLEVVILHEQPNQSRTLIEKLEIHGDVDYAVVLLTPDDEIRGKDGRSERRARQNVILELGYFCGKLDRSRVCVLYKEGVSLPSDFLGVAYTVMDGHEGWKAKLSSELERAQIPARPSR